MICPRLYSPVLTRSIWWVWKWPSSCWSISALSRSWFTVRGLGSSYSTRISRPSVNKPGNIRRTGSNQITTAMIRTKANSDKSAFFTGQAKP